MSKVILKLRRYQVGPRLFRLRPFGHLFIEYGGVGEEPWIFRGGPIFEMVRYKVNVENTLESDSRDGSSRISQKNPATLKHCHLAIKYTFSQFIQEMEDLSRDINRTQINYGLIFDNSNSVAYFAWTCITKRELRLSENDNQYIFAGSASKKIQKCIRQKDRFLKVSNVV